MMSAERRYAMPPRPLPAEDAEIMRPSADAPPRFAEQPMPSADAAMMLMPRAPR